MWIADVRYDVWINVWSDVLNNGRYNVWYGTWYAVWNDVRYNVWIPLNEEIHQYVAG